MEPMRPVVDLELVKTATFSGGDFLIQPDGVCRLNPELARQVAQLAEQHVRGMRS
jgi:CRISPR-associated protein Cas1